jgi:hypothetical protein
VERGLAAIAATLEPLRLADSSAAAMPAAQQAAVVQRQGLWQQLVALQLVSRVSLLLLVFCRRCNNAGCVTLWLEPTCRPDACVYVPACLLALAGSHLL